MQCQALTSELTAAQRHMYSPAPEAGFFDAFQTAFAELTQTATSTAEADGSGCRVSLADVLGATQTEMADIRGVSEADQLEYATILNEAYSTGAMDDPNAYLQSLSTSELDVVRRIRCLADTIHPAAISEEGAANLLLPEGYSVDLNRDNIDEVGAAKTLHFPPRDAPEAFQDAWFQATQGLVGMDYALHAMTFICSFVPPGSGGAPSPLPTNRLDSYQTIVDNYLSMLDRCRGMLPDGQYSRDYPFFSTLKELLQEG